MTTKVSRLCGAHTDDGELSWFVEVHGGICTSPTGFELDGRAITTALGLQILDAARINPSGLRVA